MTILSTSFPFVPLGTFGGDLTILEVYFSLFSGVGLGGSGACIRLKLPRLRRGLVFDFFLILRGSTLADEEPVGVSVTTCAICSSSMSGLVGVSSSDMLPNARGGLNAARVLSNAFSRVNECGDPL